MMSLRTNCRCSSAPLLLLLLLCTCAVEAWTFSGSSSSFVTSSWFKQQKSRRTASTTTAATARHGMRMDMEEFPPVTSLLRQSCSSFVAATPPCSTTLSLDETLLLQQHDIMSWTRSSSSSPDSTNDDDASLVFEKFWKWQLEFMQTNLTNLRVLPLPDDSMKVATSTKTGSRMYTMTLQSDEYKYIRLTVMDAGKATQVFTSVWYPNPAAGSLLPIFGCDLLQFQQKRHLLICDFQPIDSEDYYKKQFEHLLEPIRNQYPTLHGQMSGRFYNPNDPYFSSQLLLGRSHVEHEDQKQEAWQLINDHFFPAWQQYMQTHVSLVQNALKEQKNNRINNKNAAASIAQVLKRHEAYDKYSAENDPAHGLLASHFGKEFADDYVYKVLFPLSKQET